MARGDAPAASHPEPHRAEVTFVFSDLGGFSPLVELSEPEYSFGTLREYQQLIGEEIRRSGGTVIDMTGDSIGAVYNDPAPIAEPERIAVRAAVAMRERFGRLSDAWRKRGLKLGLGLGVHAGHATLGMMTINERQEYRAFGRTLLTAVALAGLARGRLLISERVYTAVEGIVDAEPVSGLDFRQFPAVTTYSVTRLR